MRAADVLAAGTTPLTAPAFTPGPHRFTDREYLNVVYRPDPDAFRRALPEQLVAGEPLVRFEVMHMGDVDGFGPYTESGQALACSFDGEDGEYLHGMWLDNAPATFAGREQSAYPKAFGTPRLGVEDGALVGTLHKGSLPVAVATMAYQHTELDPAEALELLARTRRVRRSSGSRGSRRMRDLPHRANPLERAEPGANAPSPCRALGLGVQWATPARGLHRVVAHQDLVAVRERAQSQGANRSPRSALCVSEVCRTGRSRRTKRRRDDAPVASTGVASVEEH